MMMRGHDCERGQGLVELAVVLPLLLLMGLALFDGGRAVFFQAELSNASRAGARVAVVNQSNDASCTEVTFKCAAADLTTGMGIAAASIPDVAITDRDGNPVATSADHCLIYGNCSATVVLSYVYQPVTPIIGNLIGPISLTGSTTMQIERTHAQP